MFNDTIRRLRHAGKNLDLSPNSNFVKLADAILSLERNRLDRAISRTKKTMGDWTGKELDFFWGALLSLQRIPEAQELLADDSFRERISSFMKAGSMGVSEEAIRLAAEAGAGVPFEIRKTGERIILIPRTNLSPLQRESALSAARRLSPARAEISIGEGSNYEIKRPESLFSEDSYEGDKPVDGKLNAAPFYTKNQLLAVVSDRWARAGAGTIAETDGQPGNMLKGGVFHSPPLGFGGRVTFLFAVEDKPANHVSLELSAGRWGYSLEKEGENISSGEFFLRTSGFERVDIETEFFSPGETLTLVLVNNDQDENEIFARDPYIGGKVTKSNKEKWLALGGLEGEAKQRFMVSNPNKTEEPWYSEPGATKNETKILYATLSRVPVRVSSLGFKTKTPGVHFEVYYSSERISENKELPGINWKKLPGSYVIRNGETKVKPFKARHVRFDFTNLYPLVTRDFPEERK